MQRSIRHAFVLALFMMLISTPPISANWYAGNQRTPGYGVKAIIHTPTTAPTITSGGEVSWVGATSYASGTNWVQTGWYYLPYSGASTAKQYTEAKTGGYYWGITTYATQSWGTGVAYRVEHSNSIGGYYAYIADARKNGWGPLEMSIPMQALLEVQGSSSNQASTWFESVQYKPSETGAWLLFDQANWLENAPYRVSSKTYKYQWTSLGP